MAAQTAFRSEETFTQKEFRRWLDERPRSDINHYELLNGRIVMTPPAGWMHSNIASTLVHLLSAHVRSRGLGTVFESSAGYDLPAGDTVEPDVSFVSAGRMAAVRPSRPEQFLRVVPNLVVEILSPSTAKHDETEKKNIYGRNGIEEYWIVDPQRKAVTVFNLGERGYGDEQTFRSGVLRSRLLPRLRLLLEKLFTI